MVFEIDEWFWRQTFPLWDADNLRVLGVRGDCVLWCHPVVELLRENGADVDSLPRMEGVWLRVPPSIFERGCCAITVGLVRRRKGSGGNIAAPRRRLRRALTV